MAKAKPVKIIDGDTFQITCGKRIRPIGYDAPEKGEKGSQKVAQQLQRLIKGKVVGLSPIKGLDRGRELRYVTVKGKPLEKLMKPYAKKK